MFGFCCPALKYFVIFMVCKPLWGMFFPAEAGRNASAERMPSVFECFLIAVALEVYSIHWDFHFIAGVNAEGKKVFLKDIWPLREEIQAVERQYVIPGMFKEVYQKIEVRHKATVPQWEVQVYLFVPSNCTGSWGSIYVLVELVLS